MKARTCIFALISILALAVMAGAQNYPSVPPETLVARAVQGQLDTMAKRTPFMYTSRRQSVSGLVTKRIIETREGLLSRVLAYGDRPLTPEERAADDARMRRLLTDPKAMEEKRKEQRQDSERVLRMYRELPRAFHFTYTGVETINGRESVRLHFTPRKDYSPAYRETLPFKALEGDLWIDRKDERLARIDATMIDDVTIGWGLLGRLYKGGKLTIEQALVGEGRWAPTLVHLDMKGKALFFKTLTLRQTERFTDFRRVPDNLTLAQAADMLAKSDGTAVAAAK